MGTEAREIELKDKDNGETVDKEASILVIREETEKSGQEDGEEADAGEGLEEGWIMWYMSKCLEEEEM
eukprot:756686-Hanusia_phi.AAC.3